MVQVTRIWYIPMNLPQRSMVLDAVRVLILLLILMKYSLRPMQMVLWKRQLKSTAYRKLWLSQRMQSMRLLLLIAM